MTLREAGTVREVPKVPEAPWSLSPQLAAALSGPSKAQQGREATASCYRGPELYNYHGRPSYFGKRLRHCQSFYSSKPKQDGKSPAQDAASGGRGEVNSLHPCCLHPVLPQGQGGSWWVWLHRRGFKGCGGACHWGKIWGHRGHRVSARHGMGLGVRSRPRLLAGSEAACSDPFLHPP